MAKTKEPVIVDVASDDVDAPVEAIGELVIGLTERERLFAEAFFEVAMERGTDVGSGRPAYRRAFPSSPVADQNAQALAAQLVRNDRVRIHIAFLRRKFSERVLIPAERVKDEIERIAFANIMDLMVVGDDGLPSFDLRGMTPRMASAIAEINIDEDTNLDTGIRTRKIKVKMQDKGSALDKLARIHGIYQDKLNVNFTVEELDNAIRNMESKIEQRRLAAPVAGKPN